MRKLIVVLSLLTIGIVFQSMQTPNAASITRGKALYAQYCMSCHQADGAGAPRMTPPLGKTDYVTGDKARLIGIVLRGLNEPLEVNGEEYFNPMASFAHMNDQQIADVLTYIRNSFGNKASAITPAEVKAQRAKIK